jgi:hypothetical protein
MEEKHHQVDIYCLNETLERINDRQIKRQEELRKKFGCRPATEKVVQSFNNSFIEMNKNYQILSDAIAFQKRSRSRL